MTAPLEVTDLRKQFAIGRPAIDGVSFAVPAGEIVVLLGPSGCGKTTTLRCVAGLEHPTGGEITIGGRVVSSPTRGILVPPRSRDLGMVFQSYAVWPHMTVRQNVVYPLKHRKIARSEPLSNLDAKLRLRLRDDLRVILKQTGITALYVTHDQAEAVVLGDRIGVMRDGKLLQIGTPDEIYNRPAHLFVANFTGATNELSGTLVARNGKFGTVDFGDGRRAEAALLQQLDPGDKVRIAVRPENIAIGKQDGANAFTASVVDRRYQGTQTIYDIDLFGHRLEVLELGTAARHAIGVEAPVSLPREACWAFRDTGPSSYD